MRITILTVGSRGDVQPFLALGKGLRAAGHEVTLATHGEWAAAAGAAGLAFARVEGAPHRFMYFEEGQRWMARGATPVGFLRLVYPLMVRLLREQLRDAPAACDGAEALVFSPLAVAGCHVAEKIGIPICGAGLQPLSPTRSFPCPMLPPLPSFGPTNWASHVMVDLGYAEAWRAEVNQWRRTQLGLPPLPHGFRYSRCGGRPLHVLYGFSSAVVPRPADWSDRLHVTGYWFLETPPDWQPPPALAEFLESGPPPVYAGLGSMEVFHPGRTVAVVREAARRAGLRLVLGGCLAGAGGDPDDTVFGVPEVPHHWLFSRVAAAVHHGGAGTTAACLRAGVPTVVLPMVSDQFFWADRVHALGAGPPPIPFTRLTVRALAAALEQSVRDERQRERAGEIGRRLRQEDGVSRAVETIRMLFRA